MSVLLKTHSLGSPEIFHNGGLIGTSVAQ